MILRYGLLPLTLKILLIKYIMFYINRQNMLEKYTQYI